MMKKILFEDACILNAAKIARFLVHRLPLEVSLAIGRGIGGVLYFFTKRRKIAYQNIRAAFSEEKCRSEMKQIARRSIQNLVMSVVELLRFPDFDERYVQKHVRIIGTEKFQPYLDQKKGLIFLTAHFGNWELLNVAAGLLGYPMVVLARNQKHPRSDHYLNSLRVSKGGQVIKKGMPIREILRALKRGKIVGILSDQDGGQKGTFVRFFNRMSSTPSGVATFALRTGAPIFPVFIFRERNVYHRVEVEGPLTFSEKCATPEDAEREILQQFAQHLESKIRKSPDQWLWAHRRWKSTPNRSVLILSDGKSGHLNQSLAVLRAIKSERQKNGFLEEYLKSSVLEVRFKNNFLKKSLEFVCILLQGRIPFLRAVIQCVLTKDSYVHIMRSYTDIVISCGTSLLGINLFVKRENRARSLIVMKPSFSSKGFDAVVVPRHDRMKTGNNVFVTDRALSVHNGEKPAVEAQRLLSRLPPFSPGGKHIGFLVGGDTPEVKFSRELFGKALEGLAQYSAKVNALIFATSSRRTPRWADELLKTTLQENSRCPLLVIASERNYAGIVEGILGVSNVVVVSGESMSMISEAVSSGKPVIVFMPAQATRMKAKYKNFLAQMSERKLIRQCLPDAVSETLEHILSSPIGNPNGSLSQDGEVLSCAVKRVV